MYHRNTQNHNCWTLLSNLSLCLWRQCERERKRADSLLDKVSALKDQVSGLNRQLQGSKEEVQDVTDERDRLLRESNELHAAEAESKTRQRNIALELEEVKQSCAKAVHLAAGHEETCRYSCRQSKPGGKDNNEHVPLPVCKCKFLYVIGRTGCSAKSYGNARVNLRKVREVGGLQRIRSWRSRRSCKLRTAGAVR